MPGRGSPLRRPSGPQPPLSSLVPLLGSSFALYSSPQRGQSPLAAPTDEGSPEEGDLFIARAPGLLRAPGGEHGQTSPGRLEPSTALVLILILVLCSPAVRGEHVPVLEQGRYSQKPLPGSGAPCRSLSGGSHPRLPQVRGRFPSPLQVNPPQRHRRCFARSPTGSETPLPVPTPPPGVRAVRPGPGTPAAASEEKPQT